MTFKGPHGFSLIELVCAMGLMSILGVISSICLSDVNVCLGRKKALLEVRSAISQAAKMAILSGRVQMVVFEDQRTVVSKEVRVNEQKRETVVELARVKIGQQMRVGVAAFSRSRFDSTGNTAVFYPTGVATPGRVVLTSAKNESSELTISLRGLIRTGKE